MPGIDASRRFPQGELLIASGVTDAGAVQVAFDGG